MQMSDPYIAFNNVGVITEGFDEKQFVAKLIDDPIVDHLSSIEGCVSGVIDGHFTNALLEPRAHVFECSDRAFAINTRNIY